MQCMTTIRVAQIISAILTNSKLLEELYNVLKLSRCVRSKARFTDNTSKFDQENILVRSCKL